MSHSHIVLGIIISEEDECGDARPVGDPGSDRAGGGHLVVGHLLPCCLLLPGSAWGTLCHHLEHIFKVTGRVLNVY